MEQPSAAAMEEEFNAEARKIFDTLKNHQKTAPTSVPEWLLPILVLWTSFDPTARRRVYDAPGVFTDAGCTMEPWEDSELWAKDGVPGALWCFTELPRRGQRIRRKAVGRSQSWSAKSGRTPKNRLPKEIRVDRLDLEGTDYSYHMLEITLEFDHHKPTVALCKISRKGPRDEESSHQIMYEEPSASNNDQVGDNHEEATDMQIDQRPQGQIEGVEPHVDFPYNQPFIINNYAICPPNYGNSAGNDQWPHVPGHAFAMGGNIVNPYSTGGTEPQLHHPHQEPLASSHVCPPNSANGEFEGIELALHMPHQVASTSMLHPNSMGAQLDGLEEQVKMPEDAQSMSYYIVPENITPPTAQDANSSYKDAISFLYETKDFIGDIVSHEAHAIASNAQNLKSHVKNLFKSLGIYTEPGNTRQPASTPTSSNQITDSVTEQAMHAAEPATEDVLEQEPAQQMDGFMLEDYVNVDEFFNEEWVDELEI